MKSSDLNLVIMQDLTPTVTAAVERIKTIRQTAVTIAEALQAQLMEQIWIIESETDRNTFYELMEHLDIDPDEADRMAMTWAGARKNSRLKNLVAVNPSDALQVINEIALAEIQLDDQDAEVARILTMPAGARRKAIRQMIDERPEPRPAPPADDDDAEPVFQFRTLLKNFQGMNEEFLALLTQLNVAAGSASPRQRESAIALLDATLGRVEETQGALLQPNDDDQE